MLNCIVKCTKGDGLFKEQKLYRVLDGKLIDGKYSFPVTENARFQTIDDFNNYFSEHGLETFGWRYSKVKELKFEFFTDIKIYGVNCETVNEVEEIEIFGDKVKVLKGFGITLKAYYNVLNGKTRFTKHQFQGATSFSRDMAKKFFTALANDGVLLPQSPEDLMWRTQSYYIDLELKNNQLVRVLKNDAPTPRNTLLGGEQKPISFMTALRSVPFTKCIDNDIDPIIQNRYNRSKQYYKIKDVEKFTVMPDDSQSKFVLSLRAHNDDVKICYFNLNERQFYNTSMIVGPFTFEHFLNNNAYVMKDLCGTRFLVPKNALEPCDFMAEVSNIPIVDCEGRTIHIGDKVVAGHTELIQHISSANSRTLRSFVFATVRELKIVDPPVLSRNKLLSTVKVVTDEAEHFLGISYKDNKWVVEGAVRLYTSEPEENTIQNSRLNKPSQSLLPLLEDKDVYGTVVFISGRIYPVLAFKNDGTAVDFEPEVSVCPRCNKYVHIDELNNEHHDCEACRALYRPCVVCGALHYPSSAVGNFDGREGYVCGSCASQYFICNGCNDVHLHTEAHSAYPRYCQSCGEDRLMESLGNINSYSYKPAPKLMELENDATAKFFGFELEVDRGSNQRTAVGTVHSFETSDGKKGLLYCKHDGSLSNGFEIVSHPMSIGYIMSQKDKLGMLFNKIVGFGYQSHNTNTCGLHVHTSKTMWGSSEDEQDANVAKAYLMLNKNFNFVLRFTRRKRENLDRWAYMLTGINYNAFETNEGEDVLKDYVKGQIKSNRYVALNVRNSATVEFRIFRGTLKLNTFFASIQFCERLIDFVRNHSLEDCVNTSMLDVMKGHYQELDQYLIERGLMDDPASLPSDYANPTTESE